MIRIASGSLLTVALLVGVAQAQWGDLKGKFVYDGKAPTPAKITVTKDIEVCGKHNLVDESLLVGPDGGIQNVVVFVRDKKVKVHPDLEKDLPESVTFDNLNCRFEPHILPLHISQTLVLHNSDPIGHNSNMQPLGDTGVNPLLPAMGKTDYKFRKAQSLPVKVSCNIHPWMTGYVFPRDNPYVAVSGEDGTFEIKNLPAGELEIQLWQEKAGYLEAPGWTKGRKKVKITAGKVTDLGVLKIDPKVFNK